jgi:hypothetical protein
MIQFSDPGQKHSFLRSSNYVSMEQEIASLRLSLSRVESRGSGQARAAHPRKDSN